MTRSVRESLVDEWNEACVHESVIQKIRGFERHPKNFEKKKHEFGRWAATRNNPFCRSM